MSSEVRLNSAISFDEIAITALAEGLLHGRGLKLLLEGLVQLGGITGTTTLFVKRQAGARRNQTAYDNVLFEALEFSKQH